MRLITILVVIPYLSFSCRLPASIFFFSHHFHHLHKKTLKYLFLTRQKGVQTPLWAGISIFFMETAYFNFFSSKPFKNRPSVQIHPKRAKRGQIHPKQAKTTQKGPKQAKTGQNRPKGAKKGQNRPKQAKRGQKGPKRAKKGQKGPKGAKRGQKGPKGAKKGQNRPKGAKRGQKGPKRAKKGQNRPKRAKTVRLLEKLKKVPMKKN